MSAAAAEAAEVSYDPLADDAPGDAPDALPDARACDDLSDPFGGGDDDAAETALRARYRELAHAARLTANVAPDAPTQTERRANEAANDPLRGIDPAMADMLRAAAFYKEWPEHARATLGEKLHQGRTKINAENPIRHVPADSRDRLRTDARADLVKRGKGRSAGAVDALAFKMWQAEQAPMTEQAPAEARQEPAA